MLAFGDVNVPLEDRDDDDLISSHDTAPMTNTESATMSANEASSGPASVAMPPEKRPRLEETPSSSSILICTHRGEIELCEPDGYDGSDPVHPWFVGISTCAVLPSVVAQENSSPSVTKQLSPEQLAASEFSDSEAEEDGKPRLSRKELKQLDREIPWRNLIREPKNVYGQYVVATATEYLKWVKWDAAEPLTDEEAEFVLSDAKLRMFVLKLRNCYRDKNVGMGPLKAKCRTVGIGCNYPFIASMDRHSPTARRLSFMCVTQVYCSGRQRGWNLCVADQEAAYLQELTFKKHLNVKEQDIFLLPPRDPITTDAGAFPAKLYRKKGNIYGMPDAALNHSLETRHRMYSAGFVSHSMDVMMFMIWDDDCVEFCGGLVCIAAFHVDDMVMAYSPHFDPDIVFRLFTWGSMKFAPDVLKFTGKEIRSLPDGHVKITQTTYAEGIHVRRISAKDLARESQALTKPEVTEFLSCVGSGQWVASNAQAWIAAWVSLTQKGSPTILDLRDMYKLMEHVIEHKHDGMTLNPIALTLEDTCCVSFGDSSWANAADLRSQRGTMVTLSDKACLNGRAPASPMEWHSHRTKRVLRSTLGAEADAADASCDNGFMVSAVWSEIMSRQSCINSRIQVDMFNVTDCKSLYDAVQKETPNVEEKRALIDIYSLRQTLSSQGMRWCPTTVQHADGLTKMCTKLRDMLRVWCQDPWVRLRHDAG
jgi:hypothetical protein